MTTLKSIAFLGLVSQLTAGSCTARRARDDSHQTETVGGNHGDLKAREQRLATMVGKDTFTFCVETGSDVLTSRDNLAAQFQSALGTWRDYIQMHGLTSDLASMNAPILALKAIYQSKCNDADLKLVYGSSGLAKQDQAKLMLSRDSLISGVFSLKDNTRKQTLAWLAGTSPAPRPTSNSFSADTLDHLDFGNDGELAAAQRYLVGRLLGNVLTPGTILERVPEQLLACARSGNLECLSFVNSKQIDGRYTLATLNAENKGQFDGCITGLGRGKLIVSENSYEIKLNGATPDSSGIIKSGFNDPSVQSIQKIEVFAVDDKQRLFFEQKSISGFVTHHSAKPNDQLEGFEQLMVNLNDEAVRLTLICNDDGHIAFSGGDSNECPTNPKITVANFWSQFVEFCN